MIQVKKIRSNAIIPKRIGDINKSAWIDLNISAVSVNGKLLKPLVYKREGKEDLKVVEYRMGDTVTLHTGLAIKLEEGHEGRLLPRSSTFKKTGLILSNSEGVIDPSYCGNEDEWMGVFYATRDGYVVLEERYMQFRQTPVMEEVEIVEVENLNSPNRGGFGTTGGK